LIDETSVLDLKQNRFTEKKTFGGVPLRRDVLQKGGVTEKIKSEQLAAAQRLCTDNLTAPNKEERP
jgi:hypothetical protein